MPKIRDLGVNFIPIAAPPPEVGPGAGFNIAWEACNGGGQATGCGPQTKTAEPPGCPAPSNKPNKYENGVFTSDAVAQLKQQLQHRIGLN